MDAAALVEAAKELALVVNDGASQRAFGLDVCKECIASAFDGWSLGSPGVRALSTAHALRRCSNQSMSE